MTIQKLASEIAKREGKKSQARIGDIREILGILGEIYLESLGAKPGEDPFTPIVLAGDKRAKQKAKKK